MLSSYAFVTFYAKCFPLARAPTVLSIIFKYLINYNLSLGIILKSLHVYDLQQFNLCCIFKIFLHDFPQLKSLSTLSQRLSYYTF